MAMTDWQQLCRIMDADMSHVRPEDRTETIGSSESPVLFDASETMTHLQLWHEKKNKIIKPEEEDEFIKWGSYLEVMVGYELTKMGYTLEKPSKPSYHNSCPGMSCNIDFIIKKWPSGSMTPGVAEVKCRSYRVWKDHGERPDLASIIQVQHSAEVIGAEKCLNVVLVDGRGPLYLFEEDKHEGIANELRERITLFWESVKNNKAPRIDFSNDGKTINDMIGSTNETVRLPDKSPLVTLAAEFISNREKQKRLKTRQAAITTAMVAGTGGVSFAWLGSTHKWNRTYVKPKGNRRGYYVQKVTEK